MRPLDFGDLHKIRCSRAEYRLGKVETETRKKVWREKYQPMITEARKMLTEAAEAMKTDPSPENSAKYLRARLRLNKLYKLSVKIWSW